MWGLSSLSTLYIALFYWVNGVTIPSYRIRTLIFQNDLDPRGCWYKVFTILS